jgi:hypothetical protein
MEIIHEFNSIRVETGITQDSYNEGLITQAEYCNKMLHLWVKFYDDLTRHVEQGGHLYVAVADNNRVSFQYTERDDLEGIKRARAWAIEENHKYVSVIYIGKGYLKDLAVINKGKIVI